MASENIIIKRSDILNTRVIADDNAKVLGVVSQLWVDIDRREVVALSLRDNLIAIASVPRYMLLSSISKIGDVILVDNEDAIEDIDVDAYSNLINCEVITETGQLLGRVRGFTFNGETGKIYSLIIASLGYPQIPEQVLSTYELPIEEIVSSGPNRLIVFEGAEERVNQLSVGVLERLGIGKAPWEREEEEYYTPTTIKTENQLPSGVPLQTPTVRTQPSRTSQPVVQETWDEDDDYEYEPVQPRIEPQQLRQRQYESIQYEEELEDEENWSEATASDRYQSAPPPRYPEPKEYATDYEDDDLGGDAWDDEPKPLNLPKKTKQPEYEEEGGY
jgi:sporulation protein YlmC with PRC-barrel domain